jgi:hypothetical protein
MAQISKGDTFADSQQLTATRLNQLVDSAQLLVGAITDQPSITANTLEATDSTIVNDAGSLKEATIGDILNSNLAITTSEVNGGTGVDMIVTPDAGKKLMIIGAFEADSMNSVGALTVGGNATVTGTLTTTGASTLNGTLNATGTSNLSNDVNIGTKTLGVFIDERVNTTYKLVAGSPVLKASGSWTWSGSSLNPRRTPFNCSISRLGVGSYKVTFTTAMSGDGYSVSAITSQWTGNTNVSVGLISRTASEVVLQVQNKAFSSSGGANDGDIDVLIFD